MDAAQACVATGTFAPVAGLGAAWHVLCNLSGHGCKMRRWLHRATELQRVAELQCADGDRLAVHVTGRGQPYVLVHGLGGSRDDWSQVAALLARHACVYRYGQRGHAERCAPGYPISLGQTAGDLALVIEKLGLARPILVGHSLGALTIMQYLRDHGSEHVGAVCFVDQSPRVTIDAHWPLGLFGSLTEDRMRCLVERLGSDLADAVIDEFFVPLYPRLAAARGRRGWLASLVRCALGAIRVDPLFSLLQDLARSDYRRVVQELGVPSMVVLGGRSHHYGGLPLAEYFRSALRSGIVHVYENAHHSPHRLEPERFVRDLLGFSAAAVAPHPVACAPGQCEVEGV